MLPEGYTGTVRGYVAEMDGKIVGSMGVMHVRPPVAFSSMAPEMRQFPRLIVTAIRMFREMLAEHYTYVVAAASPTERDPASVLQRVGFVPYTKATEDHLGVYAWQRHR